MKGMELQLTFVQGSHQGQVVRLKPGKSVVLGRSTSCQLRLEDPRISRRHCMIYSEGNRWFLEDLKSRAGTFLNQIFTMRSSLSHGDQIDIGSYSLVVSLMGESQTLCYFCHCESKEGLAIQGHLVCKDCIEGSDCALGKRYQMGKKIGEGAMGAVFKGVDGEKDEVVAVKLILAEEEGIVKKSFMREAQTMESLHHRNIVKMREVGQWRDLLFLVMEYVEGQNLRKMLEIKGVFSPVQSINLVGQIALALSHAWEKKVVHRDINPQNILVNRQGVAKLSDFGIAKVLEASTGAAITDTGEGKGTLDYIAPEQMTDAATADIRADIYSLGATFYHLLTGRPPFQAKRTRDLLLMILNETPLAPSHFQPNISGQLDEIVLKALEKDPKNRFQDPRQLFQSLSELDS